MQVPQLEEGLTFLRRGTSEYRRRIVNEHAKFYRGKITQLVENYI